MCHKCPTDHLTQVHWSEDDMNLALDSVRTGNMSINQVTRLKLFMSLVVFGGAALSMLHTISRGAS